MTYLSFIESLLTKLGKINNPQFTETKRLVVSEYNKILSEKLNAPKSMLLKHLNRIESTHDVKELLYTIEDIYEKIA